MTRFRVILGWILLATSMLGLALTFPMWLAGWVSDRTLLGLTLALSWLALIYEALNAVQIASDRHADES